MKSKFNLNTSLNRDQKIRLALLAGAVLLLLILLPLRVPVVQILLALLVAYLAYTTNDPGTDGSRFSLFSDVRARPAAESCGPDGSQAFRHVFSNAVIDLTDAAMLPGHIDIQAVFSNVSVRLPVDAAISISANGVFCSIRPPEGQSTVFGTSVWQCGSQDARAPRVRINAACVFGQISFRMG